MCVCMCEHFFVCEYVCGACIHVYACSYVGQRTALIAVTKKLVTLFLETRSLTGLELVDLSNRNG